MPLGWRMLIFTTIGFGLPIGLMAMPAVGIGIGLAIGAAAGLAYGLSMSLILGLIHVLGTTKGGTVPGGPVEVYQEDTVLVKGSESSIDVAMRAALRAAGAKSAEAGEVANSLVGKTTWNWKSFGCTVTATAKSADDGDWLIEFTSTPLLRTTLIDYGQSRQNVEHMVASLLEHLPAAVGSVESEEDGRRATERRKMQRSRESE